MTQEKRVAIKEESLPVSYGEIQNFAEAFFKSGMFSDLRSMAQAIVKIQAGRELGLPPVYSMQNINLIRDRLTTSANTMALLVKRSGKYNYRIKEHTEALCTIEFFEDGKAVGFSTFTMDDAKRADLIKPNGGWMKYPRAMLFSRAISQGARMYCPDAIGGIYTEEEMRSVDAEVTSIDTPPSTPATSSQQGTDSPTAGNATKSEKQAVTGDKEAPQVVPSRIDADWLGETLTAIHWSQKTAKSWMVAQLKVPVDNRPVLEVANSLDDKGLKVFTEHIRLMRESSGK